MGFKENNKKNSWGWCMAGWIKIGDSSWWWVSVGSLMWIFATSFNWFQCK
jgi:hypothetical protein